MLPSFPFSKLHKWYLGNGRHDLPWRDYSYGTKTLWYRVWLAETMLQQTQVERVKSYFENILEAFPTVEDLAACSYEDFFPYYKWLGYYSRARNMLAAAQVIVNDFNWIFPDSAEDLRKLPWVGPYTAEAIRAFAYNHPTLSFDTNLEKIFSRYYFGNKFQKLSKEEKSQILRDFEKYYSTLSQPLPLQGKGAGIARDINNALMDYGATISLNSVANINWENYPLPSSKFYQTHWELEPIPEKKKSSFPNKEAYVIAILHKDHKVYYSIPHPTSPCQGEEQAAASSLLTKEGIEGDFTPFLIWKNTWNPRAMIQEYFLNKYSLELSVRPPEVKSYNKSDIPYMVFYCQIQSWNHSFQSFEGLKVRWIEEGYVEDMEFWEGLNLF